ncbi:MAG: glycosyltransferase family 1 protein [Candidatus Auribacter fodinae]|uniref:Glycosyltransferase family 1 protein n=1 Tax=Candidatus Auribacter fodinae TaxID=2093366 RepID=A0A3A4R647_9BACT|nr:MAG: glycosyltransferase family 1 protein [Candidatus Auribacter fodinae]
MRIGLDGRLLLRQLRGMAVYLLNTLSHILETDRSNEYILYTMDPFEHNCPPEDYSPVLDRLRVYPNLRIVNISAPNQFIWEQIKLPVQARKDRLDLLHMTANRAPRFVPCKLVITVHDMIELLFFDAFFRTLTGLRGRFYEWRVGMYIKYMYTRIFPRADHIISVSRNSANDITRLAGIPESRITVIHEACADEFKPLGIPREGFLLVLGGMGHKNTTSVLRAHSRLPEPLREKHPLVVHGAYPHLRELAAELGNTYITVQPSDFSVSLASLYNRAVGFVYVSLYEGFGIPPLEAMACGTPVIASNRGSVPEIVGDAALKVNPESVDEIAQAMQKLLTDPDLRSKLRAGGLQQASRFSWKKCASEHLLVYQQVIDKKL